MALPNIFSNEVSQAIIDRLNKMNAASLPKWGKMNAAQMMAHCCVTYEYIYSKKYKSPGLFMKWILKTIVKQNVVNEKPYPHNSRTAPDFIITGDHDFEAERKRLIEFIQKTQKLGKDHFEGKGSHSFGKLTAEEWNNMFYKHLNHHLNQFGV